VVQTGCSAIIASAKAGLLQPEAAHAHAGPGLREVCDAVGIPRVLHLGSCVDNSRILNLCAALCAEGGIGQDLSTLPIAAAAPEALSEETMAIGVCAVASDFWLGPTSDAILREQGIKPVDGRMPGFAACVGALPDEDTLDRLARDCRSATFSCSWDLIRTATARPRNCSAAAWR
jgi:hypothetical protein